MEIGKDWFRRAAFRRRTREIIDYAIDYMESYSDTDKVVDKEEILRHLNNARDALKHRGRD